ncbi:2-deoxyribose-5-phosphate aldolase [Legionella hackeliae]|uniref:deoxyribose-phosphate aldolase n=1 Tax=Legionella hackeliae TaxID=449 RepID=A0A0A8UPV0_LEGHA|nr:deoxyribose-phosphate aldolase [Legionella hackeliae]KTD09772.1 2-deoxyribose-5-phosphate aldolase [Legionella hackeliae]CEK10900.1 putative 2-deoxyribose-5-phosphate aldolase [Legionella hackeliae]STX47638.1 2-deoxyribose-5-phosphate aldolase [Legionella hackeliae]
MNLEAQFLVALGQLNEMRWNIKELTTEAFSLIDLTLLDETASPHAVQALVEKANSHQVAAICVLPQHIKELKPAEGIKLATVVNFPTGKHSLAEVLSKTNNLLSNFPVDEIDYVFPYQNYLQGNVQEALTHCQQVYTLCEQQNVTFKVILETGAFATLEAIYNVSCQILDNGCNFLKTSTGKIKQGATPSAAFAILKAIEASDIHCGLKVSGGIKQPAQAFIYMCLAEKVLKRNVDKSWFRIGASSLLDELDNSF